MTGAAVHRRFRGILAGVVIACAVAACTDGQSRHAVLDADAPVTLADQPVHLKVSGLTPGEKVTVSSMAVDYEHRRWRGHAIFRADSRGMVSLDQARPISGTYRSTDGMGLFWSINPATGDPEQARFFPAYSAPTYQVQITVSAHGHTLAARTLTRQWSGNGVSRRHLSIASDKIFGDLFLPAPGSPRHPAVLVFGGSEGGNGGVGDAALLASHGYPALALAYFGEPGLPATLRDVPLDYFARAARLLAAQPGVDPDHLVVRGYSRGTEAALLLGQRYPDLIHGVIVYAPSAMANEGYPNGGAAWTDHGRPIPQGTIPLDHINGPVLAIAGTKDGIWDSVTAAGQIMRELDQAHDRYPHQALIYPGAGHGVGTFPYLAAGTENVYPITRIVRSAGGSRPANAAAKEKGWPRVLAFLAALDH
jgi:dienelactone hydrolase